MKKRVAITGRGVICSLGDSPLAVHDALRGEGRELNPIESHEWEVLDGGRSNLSYFHPELYLRGRSLRPLDRTGRIVAAAAKLALDDAQWSPEAFNKLDVGMVLGTMFGSMHTISEFDRHALIEGPSYASPMDFANTVISSAAGQTAIWHKLRGINSTIATGATSGLMALGYAADLIGQGQQAALLAGGADEFCFESYCAFERAGLLFNPTGESRSGTPFDARRSGFTLAEAGAFLVLEEWDSAVARGAHIKGEIRGHGNAYNSVWRKRELGSEAIACAIRAALADAQLLPLDIDCVSASANGSVVEDKNEGLAIKAIFNGTPPGVPVTAIKSALGETLGASGVLQVMDLMETMRSGILPRIANLEEAEPQLAALNLCRQPQGVNASLGLANSVGFDGHACSLVIAKAPPQSS